MDMNDRDPTAAVQLKFRVREWLRAKLDEAAKSHGLTLNAEITMRLEQSLDLDQAKRELEIEREYLRNAANEFAKRETGYLERERLLTDHLLKLTAGIALGERR
jgi:Arc-like DNA binding domain